MEIFCKIGTHPLCVVRLKYARKDFKKGMYLIGVPLEQYNGKYTKWKKYLVDDINDREIPVFFYLSKRKNPVPKKKNKR
jgi:hypothetical protein